MKSVVDRFLSLKGVVLTYLLLLLIWFGVWIGFGEPTVLMTILNRAAAWLFLPAATFLGVAIYKRRWQIAGLQIIPATIFLFLFWPYLLPNGRDSAGNEVANQLRVITFNMRSENERYKEIAQTIGALKADVVCLQEVGPAGGSALTKLLAQDFPWFHIGAQVPGGTTAIFSRIRPEKFEEIALPPDRPAVFMTVAAPSRSGRSASTAKENETGGKSSIRTFTVVSAHLIPYQLGSKNAAEYPGHIRERTHAQHHQARRLAYEILKRKHPVILGCDASTTETCFTYRLLSRHLLNAAREIGWRIGDSPPAGTARDTRIGRIDYLFYTPKGIEAGNVFRGKDTAGSDHEPVIGDFFLAGMDIAGISRTRSANAVVSSELRE